MEKENFLARFNRIYKEFRSSDIEYKGRKAFAEKLGVSLGQINGWLDGTGRPDYETLIELEKKLDVSIQWLIGASEERLPSLPKESPAITAKREARILVEYLKHRHGELLIKVALRDVLDKEDS